MAKKLDLVQERASMLARTGSFWYHTLSEQDKSTAYKLTQIGCLQRSAWQLANAGKAVLSGGYFTDYYRVLRFTDKDIQYFGTDAALQKRYKNGNQYLRANNLTLYGFIPDANGYPLGDEQSTIVAPNEEGDKVVLPANYRIEFGLVTDPDICVQAIEYKDGSLLLNGIDFQSTYGYIAFQNNPITLFPDMKFMARHITYRERNLLSYTLRLNNVYGPVDRVMDYYRVHQNIPALRLAAAQACGLAVTRTECTIVDIVPLHDGVSYIMDTGERYDAPYRHFHLKKLDKLPAGYIIGGRELFRLYWYGGTEDVSELPGIDPYRALPVRNIYIPNRPIPIQEDGYYRPAYEGTGVQDYYRFLAAKDGGPLTPATSSELENGVTQFLDKVGPRWMVCAVNKGWMSSQMQKDLITFLDREAPLGSVLTLADLDDIISEET